MRLVRVAVPVPSLEALTYGVPDGFADPAVGARVLVPLGNRILTGVTVASAESSVNSPAIVNRE
jgi:primosomal protein N'